MSDFQKFSAVVHANFLAMSEGELFTVDLSGDDLWQAYLAAFPEGTNPLFRERTEHDCSCCRNFIRNLGPLVSLKDGVYTSVWLTFNELPAPYDVVATALDALVRRSPITGVYRGEQPQYGQEFNFEKVEGKDPIKWNHFSGAVGPRHFAGKNAAAVAGETNSTVAVFARGLREITGDALTTVIDLIGSNSLYRGEEHLHAVQAFQKLWTAYVASNTPENFPWEFYKSPGARIRNTAIGTLLLALSEGQPLEDAVRAFEVMVAPANYKRTTALITPAMIKNAMVTLKDLGLESAVERRFANLSDVSINNVIWADNSAKAVMKDSLTEALLASAQVKQTPVSDAQKLDVTINDFMKAVVPDAVTMELLVANKLTSNLMSLTAPVHADVNQLFKWKNNFAWSYNGNLTDSITEKVKRAGGSTEGALRVSLAWFNPDDLDLHAHTPRGHIYFGNKEGVLDVDMNAGGRNSATDPVENMNWSNPVNGKYEIRVHQYNKRSKDRPGFVLEVANQGKLTQYSFQKDITKDMSALSFDLVDGAIQNLQVHPELVGEGIKQDVWGIQTETFAKVSTLMFSPNHWDGEATGNKHWFFMLEGCKNDQPTRGIYNEYLIDKLNEHRKVFEVLGAQTMCQPTDNQLSGLGFSSTKGEEVTVRVTNAQGATRLYNVKF